MGRSSPADGEGKVPLSAGTAIVATPAPEKPVQREDGADSASRPSRRR